MKTTALPAFPNAPEEANAEARRVDFCIVGGGLAGVIFALSARARGFQCVVVDKPELSAASRVSAGIINPIAGKRFAPFWDAEAVMRSAMSVYEALERRFGQTLLRPLRATRFFVGESERDYWFGKRADTVKFAAYKPPEAWDAAYNQRFGGLEYGAWSLDVETTVRLARAHLKESGALIEEEFDETALSFHSDGVRYKRLHAERLVMCNGWKILQNVCRFLPPKANFSPLLPLPTPLRAMWKRFAKAYISKKRLFCPCPQTKNSQTKNLQTTKTRPRRSFASERRIRGTN